MKLDDLILPGIILAVLYILSNEKPKPCILDIVAEDTMTPQELLGTRRAAADRLRAAGYTVTTLAGILCREKELLR